MSLTLGGLALDPSMDIQGRWDSKGAMSMKRTLGGKPVIFTGQVGSGTPLTLVGDEETGWISKSDLETLLAMANAPGASYTLQLQSGAYNESFTVVFDHTSGPAVSVKPLVHRIGHADGDWFFGTIKLIVI